MYDRRHSAVSAAEMMLFSYKSTSLGAIHKVRHAQGVGCPGKRYGALRGGGVSE